MEFIDEETTAFDIIKRFDKIDSKQSSTLQISAQLLVCALLHVSIAKKGVKRNDAILFLQNITFLPIFLNTILLKKIFLEVIFSNDNYPE